VELWIVICILTIVITPITVIHNARCDVQKREVNWVAVIQVMVIFMGTCYVLCVLLGETMMLYY